MDVNDIKKVTVVFKNGDIKEYQKRGLEKLRKQITKSPPLHEPGVNSSPKYEVGKLISNKPNPGYRLKEFTYKPGLNSADMISQASAYGLDFSH